MTTQQVETDTGTNRHLALSTGFLNQHANFLADFGDLWSGNNLHSVRTSSIPNDGLVRSKPRTSIGSANFTVETPTLSRRRAGARIPHRARCHRPHPASIMTARSLATRPAPPWATTCNAQQHCHTTFGPTVTCQHEIDKGPGGAGSLLGRCVSATLPAAEPAPTGSEWWSFQRLVRPRSPQSVAGGRRCRFPRRRVPARGTPGPASAFRTAGHSPNQAPPSRHRPAGAAPRLPALEFQGSDRQREPPGWWTRIVDGLLASPHYGEAQGRDWLDLVRYAETDGFKSDALRPQAFRYRDYVIRAFNQDRAYSRFVQEQIAGDELFPEDPEAVVATGFNRMWPDESNASNILLARQDALNDLTANVGNVFLGLSRGLCTMPRPQVRPDPPE
ncbi:MAG: hypothetical protein CM1200mP2_54210 [Planctomycetaceae bacterium]|nr:MAG: hypothetical protein CM1200mP2_54210 [Planctomycetaceae bacterium]